MTTSNRSDSRQKIYALIIIVLLALYALQFASVDEIIIPTPSRIEHKEQEIKQLLAEKIKLLGSTGKQARIFKCDLRQLKLSTTTSLVVLNQVV